MDVERRLELVKQVGEEVVTEEELRALLEAKANPIAYDGFEPSGTAHIAQGVMRAINVNKMTEAGFRFKMFVADWHAWANNKMGGDLERIQVTGKYLIEIWRATGMDLDKVDFVWASEFIEDEAYWKKVMNIARMASLDRVLRTTQIMGRSDKDKLSAAQILYPCMQAADIFHLGADVTQLGMDQRKVNMLAREVGPKLGLWKPVVISHHMLMGLQAPPKSASETVSLPDVQTTFAGLFDYWKAVVVDPAHQSILNRAQDAIATHSTSNLSELESALPEMRSALTKLVWEAEPIHSKAHHEFKSVLDVNFQPTKNPESFRKTIGEVEALRQALRQAIEQVDLFERSLQSDVVERATAMKMSKSNPDSAIFMTDTPQQVKSKMKKAFCPEKQVQDNPILEYYRHIIFERFPSVKIERPAKFGGDLEFDSYEALADAFAKGELHPADAKAGCAHHIDLLLEPVRKHFEQDATARDLKAQVESFKVTR